MTMTVIETVDSVTRWTTAAEAATQLGISGEALKSRRFREGPRHPRHTIVAGIVLYDLADLERYRDEWVDGRTSR